MSQFIVLLGALSRLLPHPPNVSPILAMALFGGATLPRRQAFLLPLLALFISDLGLHFMMGYPIVEWGTIFVYGSFMLIVLLGMWYGKERKAKRFIQSALASIILFFILTNFGTWLTSGIYLRTWNGFVQCYLAAIPFLRNTILGDIGWIAVFFGAHKLASLSLRSKVQSKAEPVSELR